MSARDPLTIEEAAEALGYCDAGDREVWLKAGRALKAEFGEQGYAPWLDWTEASGTPAKAKEAPGQWKSFRNMKVSIGSLIHLAKAGGWVRRKSALSADEKARIRDEREARRRESEAKAEQEAAADAAWCRRIGDLCATALRHCKPIGHSPYLGRKKIAPFGLAFPAEPLILICDRDLGRAELLTGYDACRAFWAIPEAERPRSRSIKRGTVLIPMRDFQGELWNFQIIYSSGKKLFLPGLKTGLFHLIGALPEWGEAFDALVCEGYATGASLHMATQWPVLVAWDSGNLPHIAEGARGRYAELRTLAIAGDDDRHLSARGDKNAGREAALRAAKLSGGVAVFPDFAMAEGV